MTKSIGRICLGHLNRILENIVEMNDLNKNMTVLNNFDNLLVDSNLDYYTTFFNILLRIQDSCNSIGHLMIPYLYKFHVSEGIKDRLTEVLYKLIDNNIIGLSLYIANISQVSSIVLTHHNFIS